MMEYLYSFVDTSDLITLVLISIAAAITYLYLTADDTKSRYKPNNVPPLSVPKSRDEGLISRMKNENRQVLIMYGSQTGTAEELSARLAKNLTRYGQKALLFDPEELESESEIGRLTEVENALLVLCVATYGEGDPTDNAQQLFEFIKETDISLSGVKYAVFGLGNKTYEHFNEVGKVFDKRLEELGAERLCVLGLGDDDANLEEDFIKWRDMFLTTAADAFGWQLDPNAENARQYRLELVEAIPGKYYTGEFGRINSHSKPRPPFDQKTPFFATVAANRELHAPGSDRSCRHIELDLEGSSIRYEAGDHLGVYPQNDSALVDTVIRLLDFDPDQTFKLINTDEEANKKNPFPCPTTFRVALTSYVDICAPVKPHILKAISEFASLEEEKKRLVAMSGEEGLTDYHEYVMKGRRSIVDVLTDFASCKPPIDLLLEVLPRLQVRYYSISSSPKLHDKRIHITAVVTSYKIGDRTINGVCTNYLQSRKVGDKIPIFVRKSTMRMSYNDSHTVIMIGPGTGLAPFRGFIQEREHLIEKGTIGGGNFALFFGCRHPEHDYIYKDELEKHHSQGTLTHLFTAFSRLTDKKVYVQHHLEQEEDLVYKAFENGFILVCGDARNMARDVLNTILRIIRKRENCTEEEAMEKFKKFEKSRRYLADVWS